jgi:hypothetical protein
MADEQVIKIRFATQNDELKESRKELQGLSKDEQQLVKDFRAVNQAATVATTSIQNVGKKTDASMKQASKSTKDAKKELDSLGSTASKVGGAIAAYFSFQAIVNITKEIISATAQFEKFQAVLTNTLGSKALADATIMQLTAFAAKTPFDVDQLIGSYVKLANQGFRPTEEELRKLGDLASSTGKSFDQLAEAVIDAQTGEFERLKEFGIRAAKEGDNVTFTFKGVKTTVDNTNESIRNYITSLGDAAGVSGSMAAEAATMGGSISNLGDAFGQLSVTLGKIFAPAIKATIGLISDLTASITKSFETIDEKITKQVSDNITEMAQIREDDQKKQIQELIKQGKTEEEIVNYLRERQIASNIHFINKRADLQEREIETRFALEKKFLESRLSLAGGFAGTIEDFDEELKKIEEGHLTIDEGTKGIIATYKELRGQIKVSEFAIEDGNKRLEGSYDKVATAFDAQAEANKKKSKTNDDALKKALDLLHKQEELAIRQAKVAIENAEEEAREVLRIQSEFGQKRTGLIEHYGKKGTEVYQDASIRQLEIFQSQANFEIETEIKKQAELAGIRDARKNENITAIDDIGARQKLSNDKRTQDEIEAAQQRYMSSNDIIKRGEEYEKQLKEITYNSTRQNLLNEIDLLEEKKEVKNQTDTEILKLDQQISEAKGKLLDMEYQKFKETEDKKTAAAKLAHDQRVQIAQAGLDLGVEIINAQFAVTSQGLAAELEAVQNKAKEDQRLAGENAQKKAEIENQARIREAQLRRKQAENERNAALFNIAVNTAQNVVKAYGTPPVPNFVLAGIALGAGLAQASVVSSKPIPKFNKGTASVPGVDTGVDSVYAMLRPKEAVIPVEKNREFSDLIPGIISGGIKRSDLIVKGIDYNTDKLGGTVVVNDNSAILQSMDKLNKSVSNLKQVHIGIDKNGLNVFQKTQNAKTKFENRYFRG